MNKYHLQNLVCMQAVLPNGRGEQEEEGCQGRQEDQVGPPLTYSRIL